MATFHTHAVQYVATSHTGSWSDYRTECLALFNFNESNLNFKGSQVASDYHTGQGRKS